MGAGGFAREVLWLLEDMNQQDRQWNVLGFIDDNSSLHGEELCGFPVLGSFDWFSGGLRPKVISGVGSNKARQTFASKAGLYGLEFATAIHPSVRRSRHIEIGNGCIICAGTALTTQISIGDHVNLNLNCTVGHDATIESYCNLSPGVHISGHVSIQSGVDIGTGAVVLPSMSIGSNSTIGAGAVVTKDVPANSLAVGIPAKVVRSLSGVHKEG